MLYQSLKLTNGIKVLAELKIAPSNPNFTVSQSYIKYSGYKLECPAWTPFLNPSLLWKGALSVFFLGWVGGGEVKGVERKRNKRTLRKGLG